MTKELNRRKFDRSKILGGDGSSLSDNQLEQLSDDLLLKSGVLGKGGIYTEIQLKRKIRDHEAESLESLSEVEMPTNDAHVSALLDCLWKEIISGANKARCSTRQIEYLTYRKNGLNYREIAKICNCSKDTVRTDCQRAAKIIQNTPAFGLWSVLAEVFNVSVDRIKAIILYSED